MVPVRFLGLVLLTPLLAVGPVAVAPAEPAPKAPATIKVAAANVHEGNLLRFRADRRDGTDRRAFARRLLARSTRLPDVVLVQETLGTAGSVARALTEHRRARAQGVRYAVATRTDRRSARGSCDGRRVGRFSVLRGSSILVNSQTVSAIHERGRIRTWGRWAPKVRHVTARRGFGCTEHPWIRATIRTPGGERTALLVSAHVAPAAPVLKNRALKVLRRETETHARRTPGTVSVIGGDLNLNRCVQDPRSGERLRCRLRPGHRDLLRAGFQDAVRSRHLTGPTGVVGVARRIDFLYTSGTVAGAWHDRCYQAYFVKRWRCGQRSVFGTQRLLLRCQARSLRVGHPGSGCPPAAFRRYYSDHPILLATIR